MSTSEKLRSKALPLAALCGLVSVLLFMSAMGTGARMARMSRMHRNPGAAHSRTYQPPGHRADRADRGGKKARPADRRPGPGGDQRGRRAEMPQPPAPAQP